ncbi:MAG: hypothetical protein Q9178_007266 [Gyalolechia marmorata]
MYFPISTPLFSFFMLPGLLLAQNNTSGTSSLSSNDAITITAINQLLALFSISLDLKTFSDLSSVFAPNVQFFDRSGPGGASIDGLPALLDFYTTIFGNASFQTQHTSDTVYAYDFTNTTAKSISYAEVAYFGPAVFERGGGSFVNSSVIFRERLESDYVKLREGWRVKTLSLTILVSITNTDA